MHFSTFEINAHAAYNNFMFLGFKNKTMDDGLTMDHGLWSIDYGPWSLDHAPRNPGARAPPTPFDPGPPKPRGNGRQPSRVWRGPWPPLPPPMTRLPQAQTEPSSRCFALPLELNLSRFECVCVFCIVSKLEELREEVRTTSAY